MEKSSSTNIITHQDPIHGGDLVAKIISLHGIEEVFTLSGGHISPILVSLKKKGVQVIDTRHEVNAVFAADAYARLTGKTGVSIVTAGPGVTNTITALENALLAQTPVLLIGGAAPTILKGRGALQDINQLKVLKTVTKWAVSINSVKDISPILTKAFQISQSDVPGPVFVEIPVDVLYPEKQVRFLYGLSEKPTPSTLKEKIIYYYLEKNIKKIFKDKNNWSKTIPKKPLPIKRKTPSHTDLKNTLRLLRKSNRPVMIISSGALKKAENAVKIKEAIEKIGIPVFLSGMARGLLGRSNPIQFKHRRRQALKNADLILLMGVPVDFRLDYGRIFNPNAKIVSVSLSIKELKQNVSPDIKIHADPGDFLIKLSSVLDFKPQIKEWFKSLEKNEKERNDQINKIANQKTENINPLKLCQALEQQISEKSMIIADGGDFVATAAYIINPREPLTWLDPGVFGTLGVGGGFALAAKALKQDYETWIIYGDGAAGYSIIEFDAFVRHKLPIIAVIGNNASWEQIERGQVSFFKDDVATKLQHAKYQKISEAFGGIGLELDKEKDIEKILKEAKEYANDGKPVIINAIIGTTEFRKSSIAL